MKLDPSIFDQPLSKNKRDVFEILLSNEDLEKIASDTGYAISTIRKILMHGTRNLIRKNQVIYVKAMNICKKKADELITTIYSSSLTGVRKKEK